MGKAIKLKTIKIKGGTITYGTGVNASQNVPVTLGTSEEVIKMHAQHCYGYKLNKNELEALRSVMVNHEAVIEHLERAIWVALVDIIDPSKCNWQLVDPEDRDTMQRNLEKDKAHLKKSKVWLELLAERDSMRKTILLNELKNIHLVLRKSKDIPGCPPMVYEVTEKIISDLAKQYYGYALTKADLMEFYLSMKYNGLSSENAVEAADTALLVIMNPEKCDWNLVEPKFRDEMKKQLKEGQESLKSKAAAGLSKRG